MSILGTYRAFAMRGGIALLLMVLVFLGMAHSAHAATVTAITIDGTNSGRTFNGIGAISGGGGTSRLLYDYPPQQQSEILDYLFKPGYGANLQILKVEIGGDSSSGTGAEASHMRSATDQNYNRGYEWWLMEQAKARNPNIKLYGLEWDAPGWFQASPDIDPNNAFWSHDNITYITNWISHAQSDHNLHIDYIGGWNESGYNATWFKDLKSALVTQGLTTQIVADDNFGNWNVATAMKNDPTFASAVDIVGTHYPCGYLNGYDTCPSSSDALSLNKPLWASENGSEQYDTGAGQLAKALNRDYIDGRMTATINWSLIASWYSTLPFAGDGLMQADQPWSGYYHVGKSIWTIAQTTQFAQPGWQYLDGASGFLGGNRGNGSYVSLKSPNNSDYSTIIETMDATSAQTVNLAVQGGLSTGTVHVWASNMNSTNAADYFVQQADITPSSGSYSLTVQPGYIYSVTTTTGQGKGNATSPAAASLGLPYTENFESYQLGQLAKYFDDVQGGFETANCGGGRSGICYRQVVNRPPIEWPNGASPTAPLTVFGDPGWSNVTVSADAMLEGSGYVEVIGDLNNQQEHNGGANPGYHLRVTDGGSWTLFKEDSSDNDTTLASGTTSFGINTWHTLSIQFNGTSIQPSIDGTVLASANDGTFSSGQAGLLVSKWQNAQFDNVAVTSTGGSNSTSIDDSVLGSGANQFNYTGNWGHCVGGCTGDTSGLYNGSNSWDNTANDTVSLTFSGTQINLYGVLDPQCGIGAVSIDGGSPTNVDFYGASRIGNQLLWSSPVLATGTHTLTVRVTGTKDAAAANSFVTIDRVAISTQAATTIDDSVQGTGTNQFNFHGNWQSCSNCGADLYDGTNSWDNTANDTMTFAFNGTGIKLYGVLDPRCGQATVSIDGGGATTLDFYGATRHGDQLIWSSPTLAAGSHTLTLRVTGNKDANSTDTFVTLDRADVLT